LRAGGVKQKRCSASGRIFIRGVKIKRSSANSGVEAASGHAKQRKRTDCCVPKAQGESLKGVVPRSSGEVGIAPRGWRADCLRSWQKPNADKRQCDKKWWNACFHIRRVSENSRRLVEAIRRKSGSQIQVPEKSSIFRGHTQRVV
jgi:hypothetical protein